MINKNKKNPKILTLIPARLESKRLPRKPLRLINGVPMIVRVAKRAEKISLGEVIVASGNKEICNILSKQNIKSFLTSSDHKSGTDRIYEVYKKLENKQFNFIINIQGDLPFFKKELIRKTLSLMNDPNVDIASAVCDLKKDEINDPNIVKAKVELDNKNNGFSYDFFRKVDKIKNCFHHIGIYVFNSSSLKKFVNLKPSRLEKKRNLEQMRAIENNMKIKVVKVSENPPSIDTPEDLKKIRLFCRSFSLNNSVKLTKNEGNN